MKLSFHTVCLWVSVFVVGCLHLCIFADRDKEVAPLAEIAPLVQEVVKVRNASSCLDFMVFADN